MQLDQDVATVLRTFWGMQQPTAASRHQTSRSRTVWRISIESGDLSVKVDHHPHASVVGGVSVQEPCRRIGQGLRRNLWLPSTAS